MKEGYTGNKPEDDGQKITRRKFLKKAAVLGGGVIVAGAGIGYILEDMKEGSPRRSEKKPDFDFTAEDVIKTLAPASEGSSIEYIGSGTSDFQSEPLLYGPDGNPLPPLSDWELEVANKIEGKPTTIPNAQTAPLPHFFEEKEKYINRSAEMGQNMFRFSLDFSRLCPKEGSFDEKMMAEYVQALALIKARGQEPFLTLNHFTMPKYLVGLDQNGNVNAGGWEHPDVAKHFRFYIENVTRFLGNEDKIRRILGDMNLDRESQDRFLSEGIAQFFMTINEPITILANGYMSGSFPPHKKGALLAMKHAFGEMVSANAMASNEIKTGLRHFEHKPQVGVGYNWQYYEGILGKALHAFDEYYTSKIEGEGNNSDFLALQYYFRMKIPLLPGEKKNLEYADHPIFGDIYPPGILESLKQMNAVYPQKQIFISEFGFSDKDDLRRPYWILETVRYIIEAKKMGIPVKGMLLWTLVNNFEWDFGMSQKFGLFSESELDKPLTPSTQGIRSWEVWRAATEAITSPTPESLQELQKMYETAYQQYKGAGGKY